MAGSAQGDRAQRDADFGPCRHSWRRKQTDFSLVIEAAASQYRTQFKRADLSTAADIERAFDVFAREPNGGLVLLPTPIATVHVELNDSNSCGAAQVMVSSPRARRSTPRPCASRARKGRRGRRSAR